MSCQRCNGLCVQGYLMERGTHVPVVKCVNCGNMIDLQIMINRLKQGEEDRGKKAGFPLAKPSLLGLFRAI